MSKALNRPADPPLNRAWPLLGGLTPQQFMRRHWHKSPLMVRSAWPGVQPPADRAELFRLAGTEGVECRLIEQRPQGWRLRHGPLSRRSLPPLSRPGWTLLVQGLDLHLQQAHRMLRRFGFIAQARLDDLMVSYASDGGGVGPHVDSYDVFLLQVHGRRRWRIAPPGDDRLVPGLPLKILAHFKPEQEWVLEPGDMLYLPPGWGHDGTAIGGDCMTVSIGFRSPTAGELAMALLERGTDDLADELEALAAAGPGGPGEHGHDGAGHGGRREARHPWGRRHADPTLVATHQGGRIPAGLQRFAQAQVDRLLRDPQRWLRALGCWVTEPKPGVWFDAPAAAGPGLEDLQPLDGAGVELDRRSRIAYDDHHLYLNGEAYRMGGRDAALLRELADRRRLDGTQVRRLGADAQEALADWLDQGWLQRDSS